MVKEAERVKYFLHRAEKDKKQLSVFCKIEHYRVKKQQSRTIKRTELKNDNRECFNLKILRSKQM